MSGNPYTALHEEAYAVDHETRHTCPLSAGNWKQTRNMSKLAVTLQLLGHAVLPLASLGLILAILYGSGLPSGEVDVAWIQMIITAVLAGFAVITTLLGIVGIWAKQKLLLRMTAVFVLAYAILYVIVLFLAKWNVAFYMLGWALYELVCCSSVWTQLGKLQSCPECY
ncbi:unnamed protein product, partial [Mesorhabditis spiculigera]